VDFQMPKLSDVESVGCRWGVASVTNKTGTIVLAPACDIRSSPNLVEG